MAKIAGLAVVLAVPVVGELDQRRLAAGVLAAAHGIARGGQEYIGIAPLLVVAAAHFLEAELVAIEVERRVKIANAQHGMKISHGNLCSCADKSASEGPSYMIAPDVETGIARL